MNFGTKLRTILAIASSLNTALMATDLTGFNNPTIDMVYKVVSIVLNFIIVAIAAYYNNDYTEVACKYTGLMRVEKQINSLNGFVGEDFFDVPDFLSDDEEDEEDIDVVECEAQPEDANDKEVIDE